MTFQKGRPQPKRKKKSYRPREAKRNELNRKSTHLVRQRMNDRSFYERTDLNTLQQLELQAQRDTERETEPETESAAQLLSSRNLRARIMPVEFFDNENTDDESIVDTIEIDPDDAFCEFSASSSAEAKRSAIAYHFETILKCPPEKDWAGKNGAITKVCLVFENRTPSFKKTVKKVFTQVLKSRKEKSQYKGLGDYAGNGSKPLIENSSVWAQIIADSIESGNSIAVTKFIVNQHRRENSMPSFTTSAVYGCYQRMKPQVKSVQRAKQGNLDP